MNSPLDRLYSSYVSLGTTLSRLARRVPGVGALLDAWSAYSRDQMGTIAGALAYYMLLAAFPLLLLLIAAATPFLTQEQTIREVTRFAGNYLPAADVERELRDLLRQAVNVRGPATLIAILGLYWSASGVFDLIQIGLDRAWSVPIPRPLWRRRLISLGMVVVLAALFALSFATSAVARSGIRLRIGPGVEPIEIVGLGISLVLNFFLFAFIYRVFPNAKLSLSQVWKGALLSSILWEFGKYLFVWYLLNFARLSLIYGSVGAILALLIWGYYTATIMLYGAEVAALGRRRRA